MIQVIIISFLFNPSFLNSLHFVNQTNISVMNMTSGPIIQISLQVPSYNHNIYPAEFATPPLSGNVSINEKGNIVTLFVTLYVSSGEYCDRKDCVCTRMFLTWETFANYWFPMLFTLGLYCLIDGLFSFDISVIKFHPHLL